MRRQDLGAFFLSCTTLPGVLALGFTPMEGSRRSTGWVCGLVACGLSVGVFAVVLAACSSPHTAAPGPSSDITTLPYDGGVVEWDGWAGEFFTQYCVLCHNPNAYCTECHAPGDPRTPYFTEQAPVVAHAAMIQCGVAVTQDPDWDCGTIVPEQFPALASPPTNPFPSDEDRERLVGWIDAGCP